MRFHIIGLPHSKVNKDFGCCAFSTKILKFTKILDMLGYEYFVYAPEGSTCNNLVPCLSDNGFKSLYPYDHKVSQIDRNNKAGRSLFNDNTIREINARKQPGDFVLVTYGRADKRIVDGVGLPAIEMSVGYPSSNPKRHRIFESYARMHKNYGQEGTMHPNMYSTVIHAFFDPKEFPYIEKPAGIDGKPYAFRIGRPNWDKGRRVAVEVCKHCKVKLILAGQEQNRINKEIKEMGAEERAEHIGYVMPEERAKRMGNAIATFTPSLYVEPFGWTHVESMLCGTPVITTDFGAFTETVEQGRNGYRCMLFKDFVSALENIHLVDRDYCHESAVHRFGYEVIADQYDRYFKRLENLYNGCGRYSLDVPFLTT